MKAKTQNVKIQSESLHNESLKISYNPWYFVIMLGSYAKNLKSVVNVSKLPHSHC